MTFYFGRAGRNFGGNAEELMEKRVGIIGDMIKPESS